MLHRDASVDHDQVYSLLGIGRSFLRPDYSGDPESAFTQTAFQVDAKRRAWFEMRRQFLLNVIYFARDALSQVKPAVIDGGLYVDGEEVDAVTRVLPDLFLTGEPAAESEDGLEGPAASLRCPESPTSPYPEGWLWGEVWLRTLCLDYDWGRSYFAEEMLTRRGMNQLLLLSGHYRNLEVREVSKLDGTYLRSREFCKERQAPLPADMSPNSGAGPIYQIQWERVKKHIKRMMDGCRLFVTRKGYLGCGNQNVVVGDKLFLLPGTTVPTVLRSLEKTRAEPEEAFREVSDAFVHGLMDDQRWKASLDCLKRIRIE
ncbi:Heterokaryon incompatibility protein 6, OR allele 6 [Colletotrichum plurivorum]|uniref:Heterokaryon incompatibility protein 6, OR allele 6 n=1 Tax=Colletotrichum plurivorum TaxID=2175906 RepID=A0A8H6N872_9PEZI|nr:Heterokaryon incompatibility protein 6, OR allele 6 [Colletotrichum plurivorum]